MLIKPRLVIARQQPGQPSQTIAPEPGQRIMRPETAIQMRQMMEGVVLHGTGKKAALAGYTSGGKTGSAQVFDLHAHVYTHTYNASFLGFAPVVNPQVVIAVTLNRTTHGSAGFGGVVAAPVFREVATTALRIFDVPKDLPDGRPLLTEQRTSKDDKSAAGGNDLAIAGLGDAPDVWASAASPQDSARASAAASGAAARSRAVSSVTPPPVHADAKASAETSPADRRPFLTASADPQAAAARGPARPSEPQAEGTKVPDFRGWPLSSVLEEAAADGFEVEVQGSGVARVQDPPPGSYLPARAAIRVQFTK
jgi:cell division protein FtsI (penicillin-binding protein 3)